MSNKSKGKKDMSNPTKKISASKRKLVIGAVGVTGMAAAKQWSQPIVNAVVTPAHAQTSLVLMLNGSGNGSVSTSVTFMINS